MSPTKENAFPFLLGVVNAYGYLCATVPPTILDPLLTTHVRFGPRVYPHAWIIAPISLLVFLFTWAAFTFLAERLRAPLGGVPLLIASAFSNVFIFSKELPHINIVFVTTVWLVITMLWTWIRYSHSNLSAISWWNIDTAVALD